jgi:hypothetical protein
MLNLTAQRETQNVFGSATSHAKVVDVIVVLALSG